MGGQRTKRGGKNNVSISINCSKVIWRDAFCFRLLGQEVETLIF